MGRNAPGRGIPFHDNAQTRAGSVEALLLRGQVVVRDGEDEENFADAADEEGRGGRSGDIGLEAAARRTLRMRAI